MDDVVSLVTMEEDGDIAPAALLVEEIDEAIVGGNCLLVFKDGVALLRLAFGTAAVLLLLLKNGDSL